MKEPSSKDIPSIGNNRLAELRVLHREVHEKIDAMIQDPYANQIQLRRLKREKLQIKDAIQRIRSQMIPDLDA
jgi:hypothetical protein